MGKASWRSALYRRQIDASDQMRADSRLASPSSANALTT
jgi:hypothetical protein